MLLCSVAYPITPIEFKGENRQLSVNLLAKADAFFTKKSCREAIKTYQLAVENKYVEKAALFKKITLSYSALHNIDESLQCIEKCLISAFDTSILMDSGFDPIWETPGFNQASEKYTEKYTIWSFMYLYVALIGFYIAAIIHFNKKIDLAAKLLISSFIFIHSFFILHICLVITHLHYKFPHSYAMSTCFSFLYGPLLYFYFKRIAQKYSFKKKDLLHLVPTLLLLFYLVPLYYLPGEEKLRLIIERITIGRSIGDITIIVLKLASLIIYGYFIRKVYRKAKKDNSINKENKVWQKNIFRIHSMYIICYAAYGILLSNNMTSGFFYHLQIVSMALMVMYMGYSANVQPNVFSGGYSFGKGLFFKYKKSGLTQGLSNELKENMIYLFDHEKIYKENDINLDTIAERLNTTRHNASQVINEHFKINFHELVNKYRINEAKSMLEMDDQHNLNIIDIAYEVGYNNKVTFNKAFKKDTNLTPSEYQKVAIRVRA